MKVLVFGGTMLMGKHLVYSLIEKEYDITIATRGITPDDFGDNVKRVVVDRTDDESMKAVLSQTSYDVIFDSLAFCSNDVKYVLDHADCGKYIFISTSAVYKTFHNNITEEDFDPYTEPLIWCGRDDYTYDVIKQQAECAVVQGYPHVKYAAVRVPVVLGRDDYLNRLYFYVDHVINQKPMFINNIDVQMAFVRSDEAGKFISFLAETDFIGTINGASEQTVSMKEVIDHITAKTGNTAVLSDSGAPAPYNNFQDFTINVDKAKNLGFTFTPLKDWIFDLTDYYIDEIMKINR